MKSTVIALAAAALLAGAGFGISRAAETDDPKETTKQVMAAAHKSGLHAKVIDGKASDKEKLELLDYYISLSENKPTKGTQESWDAKTNALIVAAAKVVVGREDGSDLLKKATVCADCHKVHKP